MTITSGSLTATGSVTLTKPEAETLTLVQIGGTYGTVTFVFEGSLDGTNYFALAAYRYDTDALVTGTVAPSDNAEQVWKVPSVGLTKVRARVTAIASGTAEFVLQSGAYVGLASPIVLSSMSFGGTTFTAVTSTGNVVVGGKPSFTDVGTLAATGSTQGDAAAITNYITTVSAADGTKGVVLPTAVAGTTHLVYNSHASNGLKVYPNTSDTINGGSANAAHTMEGSTLAVYLALDTTNWASIFTANS